jgi:hypothetical protein
MMLLVMDQATDHVTYRTLDRMIKQFAAQAAAHR